MACLNCGHPFSGQEKFCPDCGQANKGSRITFGNFIREIFNGFFNFDAKFWKTIIPLLIRPGVVSRNYIQGKRQQYTNPFRFYLTVSIIFFLLLGVTKSINKFKSLKNGDLKNESSFITFEENDSKKNDIDSLKKEINTGIKNSLKSIDSTKNKETVEQIAEKEKETTNINTPKSDNTVNQQSKDSFSDANINTFTFFGQNLDEHIHFSKKYPDLPIDDALDSLKQEKTFTNRFLYNRAKVMNSFMNKEESREQFGDQLLSYGSISLFILLPLFTLFFKLFYFRKKYNYVDHLIFVFHEQTVFFMLLIIYLLLQLFTLKPNVNIFVILFLLHLFIALKHFYQQGYLKTVLKFLLLNISYMIVAFFGIVFVLIVSFTLF